MNETEYAKEIAGNNLTDSIFKAIFTEAGTFTVIPLHDEHTKAQLQRYNHIVEIQALMRNPASAPGYLLISKDKKRIYIVDVIYRTHRIAKEIKQRALDTHKTWNTAWLFIASPDGFYFGPCSQIAHDNGFIGGLFDQWVPSEMQQTYLASLNSKLQSLDTQQN